MKIRELQISNVLSFGYVSDIAQAEVIEFDDGLNIIIGENGSGKSTALEVINFLLKRVFYREYQFNDDLYQRRRETTADERQTTISPANDNTFSGFRLDRNWETEDKPQKIRLSIELDDIDVNNLSAIATHQSSLQKISQRYTRINHECGQFSRKYTLDIILNSSSGNFELHFVHGEDDFGIFYLREYNYLRLMIEIHNLENSKVLINQLHESVALIGCYRNYHSFNGSVSLKDSEASHQIQKLNRQGFQKSVNASEQGEPGIFGLVRLRVAEKHFNLSKTAISLPKREQAANNLPFLKLINDKLAIIRLVCKIKLINSRTWEYAFEFFDVNRGKRIGDINSLSAGQKAIIHLIFESYGRGDIKGGLIIIDEPEIHLHYQFQNEYLQVIKELNREQKCQYILVTHSEALISSETISFVKRFALTPDGLTTIKSPILTTEEKDLIRILDNMRSTYAFFSKKVLLVEGDSDRYFFRAALQNLFPKFDQEISVLNIGGKNEFPKWVKLFSDFGLKTYCIGDFDLILNRCYPSEPQSSLTSTTKVATFKLGHPDWARKIGGQYRNKVFILKYGDLEHYMGISKKGLSNTIKFCKQNLRDFLRSPNTKERKEILMILKRIAN